MTGLPVQKAVDWLHDVATYTFGLRSLDNKLGRNRSKVQLFALTGQEGKQFAIRVGDRDEVKDAFTLPETRVYLSVLPPGDLQDVTPMPGYVDNGSRLAQQDSLLKPPNQFAAMVQSLDGLKALLSWYTNTPLPASAIPTAENPMISNSLPVADQQQEPSNIILYGPPGTGKTYATVSKAVQLCDGYLPGVGSFEAALERYEVLRQSGRISFVTFHQAFGYEEFVEGIRPVTEDGQITYRVKSGVFKSACERARIQKSVRPGLSGKPLKERQVFKMSLGKTWSEEGRIVFDYCVQNECVLLGWGGDIDFTGCGSKSEISQQIQNTNPSVEKIDSMISFVNIFKNEMQSGDLIVVTYGNKKVRAIAEVMGDYEYAEDAPFQQMRKVRWVGIYEPNKPASELYEKELTMASLYRLNHQFVHFDVLEEWVQGAPGSHQDEAHVLIIDEINRANISKVFGELITLIEPDKREGQSHPVTVKLPYSGEDFCVPGNLHIIGTMNTADRSIALLDTALRRRFEFEELMPEPTLLASIEGDSIDLAKMLTVINQRIEVLYDRDHAIGHAYFLKVKNRSDLERVFRKKLIPLLQEYFHESWQKIRHVLADSADGDFIHKEQAIRIAGADDYDLDTKSIYRVNPDEFSVAAFQRIYAGN